jgi:putative ABC transport system ATP-binding protein
MQIFQSLNAEGKTIIIITHESDIASQTKRIIHIRDGNIV